MQLPYEKFQSLNLSDRDKCLMRIGAIYGAKILVESLEGTEVHSQVSRSYHRLLDEGVELNDAPTQKMSSSE